MVSDILIFTPVYARPNGRVVEPETIEAIFAIEWDGPISYLFQRDNPYQGDDERVTGVRNHLHQYQRGRETFLQGKFDAMLVIESDIIPPPSTLRRLAALDADIAYGAYMFRAHDYNANVKPVVNLSNVYPQPNGERARNTGKSMSTAGEWPPKKHGPIDVSGAGFGCTLIKRHVLEALEFRTLETLPPRVHCDTYFTQDAWRAGYSMKADTRVICGHKTPEGEVLWPPE